MEELLKMYDEKMAEFAEGDIVRGRVLQVTPSEVIVDIGYKSEGAVPIDQMRAADGQLKAKPGDDIDVYIERLDDASGYVVLSRERAERMLVWDRIEEAYHSGAPITGRV